jgi:hypothetical protein
MLYAFKLTQVPLDVKQGPPALSQTLLLARSKKTPTFSRPKSIPQTLRILYHLIPSIFIHKSAAQTHIAITIPDAFEFTIFVF